LIPVDEEVFLFFSASYIGFLGRWGLRRRSLAFNVQKLTAYKTTESGNFTTSFKRTNSRSKQSMGNVLRTSSAAHKFLESKLVGSRDKSNKLKKILFEL